MLSAVSAFGSLVLEARPEVRRKRMKKPIDSADDELRPEYDLHELLKGGFVRGKYAKQYRAGTNLVLLRPNVRKAFRDDKAVNDALRLVMQLRGIRSRARAS